MDKVKVMQETYEHLEAALVESRRFVRAAAASMKKKDF